MFDGYYKNGDCVINFTSDNTTNEKNKDIFATEEQAEASIALAQLSQLREVYRNGWVPDWRDNKEKYVIYMQSEDIRTSSYASIEYFLSFQDAKTRDLFLENFKDLIEQAKPLMS